MSFYGDLDPQGYSPLTPTPRDATSQKVPEHADAASSRIMCSVNPTWTPKVCEPGSLFGLGEHNYLFLMQ